MEDSGVADSQVTKPCMCVTHAQCASWCHHHDSSRAREYTKEKLGELNRMTDNEVLTALKTLEPSALRKMGDKQLNIQVKLLIMDTYRVFCKQALVDSGSSSSCINQKFVKENNLNTIKLLFLITCYNADRSMNKDRSITEVIKMKMTIRDYQELIQLLVTNLSNYDLFLEYNWLQKYNLSINWRSSLVSLQNYQQWCRRIYIPKEPEKDAKKEIVMTWQNS